MIETMLIRIRQEIISGRCHWTDLNNKRWYFTVVQKWWCHHKKLFIQLKILPRISLINKCTFIYLIMSLLMFQTVDFVQEEKTNSHLVCWLWGTGVKLSSRSDSRCDWFWIQESCFWKRNQTDCREQWVEFKYLIH